MPKYLEITIKAVGVSPAADARNRVYVTEETAETCIVDAEYIKEIFDDTLHNYLTDLGMTLPSCKFCGTEGERTNKLAYADLFSGYVCEHCMGEKLPTTGGRGDAKGQ